MFEKLLKLAIVATMENGGTIIVKDSNTVVNVSYENDKTVLEVIAEK